MPEVTYKVFELPKLNINKLWKALKILKKLDTIEDNYERKIHKTIEVKKV